MNKDDCPDTQALRALIDADFQDSNAADLVAHIDHCVACQAKFAELEREAKSQSAGTRVQPAAFVKRMRRFVRGETLAPVEFLDDDCEMPEVLGEYRIDEELGRGGMGVVYKAWDTKLLRTVAIKRMRLGLAQMPDIRQRILNEARAVAQLSHPSIVSLFTVQDDASPPYFVMEYVDGKTLQELVDRKKKLPVSEVTRIGLQIATALAVAHEAGVIHCDLKPANVLLTLDDRDVRVTDFGIALAQHDQPIDEGAKYLGTPHYMSPEQFRVDRVDHRSDLFGLGVLLFRALTGQLPFEASSIRELREAVCEHEPPEIESLRPDAPNWLCELTRQLLQKNADQRPQSARDVVTILERGAAERKVADGHLRKAAKPAWLFLPFAAIILLGIMFKDSWNTEFFATDDAGSKEVATGEVEASASLPGVTDVFTSDGWTWTEPEPLGVQVFGKFTTPFISQDGLTFLFGDGDDTVEPLMQHVMIATRQTMESPWSSAVPFSAVNDSGSSDVAPTMSADGLTVVFASSRDGGFGDFDLWMTTRESLDSPWTEPSNLGAQFNSSARESHPALSPDGLSLAYVPSGITEHGSSDIYVATRPNQEVTWSTPRAMPATVNSPDQDRFPKFISDDSLCFVRIGYAGQRQILVSQRIEGTDEWSWAKPIAPIPGIVLADGCICSDEQTLIFQNDPVRSSTFDAPFGIVKRIRRDDQTQIKDVP